MKGPWLQCPNCGAHWSGIEMSSAYAPHMTSLDGYPVGPVQVLASCSHGHDFKAENVIKEIRGYAVVNPVAVP